MHLHPCSNHRILQNKSMWQKETNVWLSLLSMTTIIQQRKNNIAALDNTLLTSALSLSITDYGQPLENRLWRRSLPWLGRVRGSRAAAFCRLPFQSSFCRSLGNAELRVQLSLCLCALNYLTSSINPVAGSSSFYVLRAPLVMAGSDTFHYPLACRCSFCQGILIWRRVHWEALITFLSCFYTHWFISISFFNSEANLGHIDIFATFMHNRAELSAQF